MGDVNREGDVIDDGGPAGRARALAAVATLIVAVAVIVAVALTRENTTARAALDDASTRSPIATPAIPTKREERAAVALAQRGEAYAVGANGAERVLTVWRTCRDSRGCRYAWDLRGSHFGLLTHRESGAGPVVYPAGNGYVLKPWNRRGVFVGEDGSKVSLHPGPPQPVQADTVVVRAGKGLQLVNPTTAETWPVPTPPGDDVRGVLDAAVDANGTLWTLPAATRAGTVSVSWLDADGWHSRRVDDTSSDHEVPGGLVVSSRAGAPTSVAVMTTFDGATALPVGTLAITNDGGHSWHELTGSDVPFATADQMAATSEGALYVADAFGHVWRSVDPRWSHFIRAASGGPVLDLSPAGQHVLVRVHITGARLHLMFLPGGSSSVIP